MFPLKKMYSFAGGYFMGTSRPVCVALLHYIGNQSGAFLWVTKLHKVRCERIITNQHGGNSTEKWVQLKKKKKKNPKVIL